MRTKNPNSTCHKVAEYLKRRGVGQVVSLGELEQSTGRESNQVTAAICTLEARFNAVTHCGDGHYRVLAGIDLYFSQGGRRTRSPEKVVRQFVPKPKLAAALGVTEEDLLRGAR